ncbi:MAG: hypothetical protein AB7R90_19375 [Reyranellaceae bacterium]
MSFVDKARELVAGLRLFGGIDSDRSAQVATSVITFADIAQGQFKEGEVAAGVAIAAGKLLQRYAGGVQAAHYLRALANICERMERKAG